MKFDVDAKNILFSWCTHNKKKEINDDCIENSNTIASEGNIDYLTEQELLDMINIERERNSFELNHVIDVYNPAHL